MARTTAVERELHTALDNAKWLLNPNAGSEREVDDQQMIEVARELAENLLEIDKRLRKGKVPPTWRSALEPDRECHCAGWLHMSDSMGRGPGVERCDTCRIFKTDTEAILAHTRDCGCDLGMLPPCAASMGCLCAGHARGDSVFLACDTNETPRLPR